MSYKKCHIKKLHTLCKSVSGVSIYGLKIFIFISAGRGNSLCITCDLRANSLFSVKKIFKLHILMKKTATLLLLQLYGEKR